MLLASAMRSSTKNTFDSGFFSDLYLNLLCVGVRYGRC